MLFLKKDEQAERELRRKTEPELIVAIQTANERGALLLIKAAEASGDLSALDEPDSHGSAPLIRALANNMEDVAVELVRAGASLLARSELGEGSLGMAIKVDARKAALAMIERLDSEGAAGPAWAELSEGPASLDWEEGKPGPLMLAIERGHADVALALARSGAPISKKDARKAPLLCAAIEAKMSLVAMALVRKLASGGSFEKVALRKAGKSGMPPLYEAINIGDEALAVELVRAGASPFGWSAAEETALGLAIEKGMKALALEIVDNVDQWGKSGREQIGESSELLMRAIDSCQAEVAEAIIKKDGKIGRHLGAEPLLISAIGGGMDGVALAIIGRASSMSGIEKARILDGPDSGGLSPMGLAAAKGKAHICEELLAAGADLALAKKTASKNAKAIELLLAVERGAQSLSEAEDSVAAQASRARERLAKALSAASEKGAGSEDGSKKGGARRAKQ